MQRRIGKSLSIQILKSIVYMNFGICYSYYYLKSLFSNVYPQYASLQILSIWI